MAPTHERSSCPCIFIETLSRSLMLTSMFSRFFPHTASNSCTSIIAPLVLLEYLESEASFAKDYSVSFEIFVLFRPSGTL